MIHSRFAFPSVRVALKFTGQMLCLLSISGIGWAVEAPVKSPNDDNAYRYLSLDNQLEILLVSDPESDKAAASMNVAVGSGDDPADREGLSHFLEHMLFLGTEKYPAPGEYQQFIKSHGGSHNAFTAFRDTNYFFDVQAAQLDSALDRFAEQFASPLFTAELVDRERKAVHSEYSSKLRDDSRRVYSARKAISNPEHGFHQFAVGNLTTLENTDERPLRRDLLDFWHAKYSANLMTLAVYGPQSLDALETMVRERFSRIENRNLAAKVHDQPLFAPNTLPAKLRVATLKDTRSLILSFPIPSQEDQYQNKPVSYVASLLGHEGPGSLFDRLKSAGLVESLSAGTGMDTGTESAVEISMSLTPEGLASQQQILDLTFAYIDKIRDKGISQRQFDEMKQLAEIDFRFRETPSPVRAVTSLSMQMRHVESIDVLRAPWMMEEYVPQAYRDVLQRLTPDNVLISVREPDPGFNAPNKTEWYGAEWTLSPLDPDTIASAPKGNSAESLALPPENPFIPQNLAMISGSTMDKPALLGAVGGMDVWYARDTRFETPKANLYLSLRTPAARASARSNVLTKLMVDAIQTNLNASAYPAQLAGLNYSVYTHLRGVTVRVGGYSDKLHTLTGRIMTQLAAPTLTEQRFNIARERMIDGLLNKAKNRPVEQTAEFLQTALIQGVWSTEEKLAAARDVTLEELQSFSKAFLAEVDPVMLIHGNVTQASALNFGQRINASLLKNSERTTVKRSRVRALPASETVAGIQVSHPDTGYSLYVQGNNTGFAERATYSLLAQVIASPFYEEIRTNRQLGYIVYATSYEFLETPALAFIVQSPETKARELDEAVQAFATEFSDTLTNMSDSDLEREKQAVISKLLEKDRQLGDISGRYWREIDRGNDDNFDSRERMAEAIHNVSQEDLIQVLNTNVIERTHALRTYTQSEPAEEKTVLDTLLKQPFVPDDACCQVVEETGNSEESG